MYLLVNPPTDMLKLSIESTLLTTDSTIIVGYLSERDLLNLPQNSRISTLNLSPVAEEMGVPNYFADYQSYTTEDFFQIVKLKWPLIERILRENPSADIVYTDVDVIWLNNPIPELLKMKNVFPDMSIAIQNNSFSPDNIGLCMGFVFFVNSKSTMKIVEMCESEHMAMYDHNPRVGDDAVITHLYISSKLESQVKILSQATFPTGNLVALAGRNRIFPGISNPPLYIFHANYVVGEKKKILLMFAAGSKKIRSKLPLRSRIFYHSKLIARKILVPLKSILFYFRA